MIEVCGHILRETFWREAKPKDEYIKPIVAGGTLFSDGYFSMNKKGLEVRNFLTFTDLL